MHFKTAVITGASRGIGRAIAIKLASEGYQLALCCHQNREALTEVQHAVCHFGIRCITYCGDMGDPEQTSEFFKLIRKEFSRIDVLVNNAGISYIGLLQDMTPEQWNTLLQTNLSSVFYCCREAIPTMLSQQSGKIFNISSVWGEVGASMEVAYSATKGGLDALTKALAKELAPSNIQVNSISCGYIDTEMNKHLTLQERQDLFEDIPSGRPGEPEEVAGLIHSLLSAPDYLTGQVIRLDGGWI